MTTKLSCSTVKVGSAEPISFETKYYLLPSPHIPQSPTVKPMQRNFHKNSTNNAARLLTADGAWTMKVAQAV